MRVERICGICKGSIYFINKFKIIKSITYLSYFCQVKVNKLNFYIKIP